MAGSDPNFDPAGFRTAIKATMRMGIPSDPDQQLVWHFPEIKSYSRQDPTLNPYDWTSTPSLNLPADPALPEGELTVDYALEFARGAGSETEVGSFDTSRLVVTLLDSDFEAIRSAEYATIGNVHYDIDFSGPPMGLFEVTVHQVYLTARDQA